MTNNGWPSHRSLDGGIDRIPLDSPGALWLCGKHLVGPDPEAALARVGASTIVCLNEAHELAERYPEYVAWLGANQPQRAIWHPVPDLHAPPVDEARSLLAKLRCRLDGGEQLVVHCGAGIGRAGTLAVAVLLDHGLALGDALEIVRGARPMAGPEAGAQHALVVELQGTTGG